MSNWKRFIVILSFLSFCIVAGWSLYKWFRYGEVQGGDIFFSILALSIFFEFLTWGPLSEQDQADELEKHIKTQSARISYFVLILLSLLILIITEGVTKLNDIQNLPLLIVVSLTILILPVTEFFYSRKYR
jgi:hypothetical protein